MTVLSAAFAAMDPGEWFNLTTTGLTRDPYLINPWGADDILPYAGRSVWDPIYKQFRFWGAPHAPGAPSGEPFNQIVYDDATNTWTLCQITSTCPQMVLASTPGVPTTGDGINNHAFDFNAFDPVRQDFYRYIGGASTLIAVWNVPTTPIAWNLITPTVGSTAAPTYEWFPDMDGGEGGLVLGIMVGSSTIYQWHHNGDPVNLVITLSPVFGEQQNYHTISAYSPVHQCVAVGGGNNYQQMGVIWADGTGTQITAPGVVYPGITTGKMTCDPVSGDFLILNGDDTFWQLNPVTEVFTQLPNPPNSAMYPWASGGTVHEFTYAPIPEYGGVMFVHSSGTVFLYKHATATPTTDKVVMVVKG